MTAPKAAAKKADKPVSKPTPPAPIEAIKYDPVLHVLRTPCEVLNLVGAGGIPMSQMVEVWGGHKSGKSTVTYQTAEYFLEDYGDLAMLLILDAENAASHDLRIRKVFKIDRNKDSRVNFEPAFTLEEGQAHIGQYVNLAMSTGKFLMVIWDSITASQPKAEYAEVMKLYDAQVEAEDAKEFAGGLMLKPRVIRAMTNSLLAVMHNKPVTIFFINQVTAQITRFGATETSGGGNGLKHNIGTRLHMDFQKNLGDSEYYKAGTLSFLELNKSRTVPGLRKIPIFIQDQLGGRIVPGEEIVHVAKEMGILKLAGGRYSIHDDYLPDDPSEEMQGSKYLYEWQRLQPALKMLRDVILADFRRNFQLVNWAWEDLEQAVAAGGRLMGKIGSDSIDMPDAPPELAKGKSAAKREAMKAADAAARIEAKEAKAAALAAKADKLKQVTA